VLLSEPEYFARSIIGSQPSRIFSNPSKAHESTFAAWNYDSLSTVCSDVGFEGLSAELSSFRDSNPEVIREAAAMASSMNEDAMKRLSDHEE
jgi:hypothetical protein